MSLKINRSVLLVAALLPTCVSCLVLGEHGPNTDRSTVLCPEMGIEITLADEYAADGGYMRLQKRVLPKHEQRVGYKSLRISLKPIVPPRFGIETVHAIEIIVLRMAPETYSDFKTNGLLVCAFNEFRDTCDRFHPVSAVDEIKMKVTGAANSKLVRAYRVRRDIQIGDDYVVCGATVLCPVEEGTNATESAECDDVVLLKQLLNSVREIQE